MTLTRQRIEKLAEILGRCDSKGHLSKTNIHHHIRKWCEESNPRFDRRRFFQAVEKYKQLEIKKEQDREREADRYLEQSRGIA